MSGRFESLTDVDHVTLVDTVDSLKSRRNGMGAKPNVYKRSLEARDFTNAYLAEVERKAAGLDEPARQRSERLATYLTAGIVIALVLFAIGLRVL